MPMNSVRAMLTTALMLTTASSFAEEPPARSAPAADVVTFVTLGYGDLHDKEVRSLDFVTERLNTATAQAVVRVVPSYNAFNGEEVAQAIGAVGGKVTGWSFGRKGSPLLTVQLPYWTSQRQDTPSAGRGEKITEAQNAALVEELKARFTPLHPDEMRWSPDNHELVMWWD